MSKQSAAILFSHGSILSGSGAALCRHADAIRQVGHFATVEVGYLNYSEPPIEEAVANCVRAGANRIIIIPYFLVAGQFVRVDLPARLESIQRQNPALQFILARAVEDAPQMAEIVREQAKDCATAGHGSKRGLLLALHGSPKPEANLPAIAIADHLAQDGEFYHIGIGYLDCNQPDIFTAIAEAANAGVTALGLVPYFLHTGRHVEIDIPQIVLDARREFPAMDIQICPSVGESRRLAEVLMARAAEAMEKAE